MSEDAPLPATGDGERNTTDEALRIPLAEEVLTARIAEQEQGHIRIHKRVETVPMRADIDLVRETARIDRVPRDEVVDAAREPWYEEETLIIPRYEERLVTEKRLVLVEEIRVRIRPETERVQLRDEVRREVVDIDEVPTEPEP